MRRWVAVGLALLVVGGLLAWQWRRERLIATCVGGGGIWDGPLSRCLPKPDLPILHRGLQRS